MQNELNEKRFHCELSFVAHLLRSLSPPRCASLRGLTGPMQRKVLLSNFSHDRAPIAGNVGTCSGFRKSTMSIFNVRERAFEQIFANNEEAKFRVIALRNRMLAEWTATQIGLRGDARQTYVDHLMTSAITLLEDEPFAASITEDLKARGASGAAMIVREKMTELGLAAAEQLRRRIQ
jgi:hypothetical protein